MENRKNIDSVASTDEVAAREPWAKPEIVSFKPVSSSEGINIRPFDGIANLT